MKRILVLALSVILALVMSAPIVLAQSSNENSQANENPTVLPPAQQNSKNSYAQLSAKWWQWAFSIPAPDNPFTKNVETDGAKCKVGQSGETWFLAGSIGATDQSHTGFDVDRVCDVPAGKKLFFPIINTECSTVEGNGSTDEELSKCAKDGIGFALQTSQDMKASVDGVPIKNLDPSKTPYHVASGPFTFTLPDNSIDTFCNGGTQQCGPLPLPGTNASADGVYLLLAPLPKGKHEIRFGGKFFVGYPFEFDENNRYVINVV